MDLLSHFFRQLLIAALHILAARMVYQIYWTPHTDRRRRRIVWTAVVILCLLAAVPVHEDHYIHIDYVAIFLMSFLYEMRGSYRLLGLALTVTALTAAEAVTVAGLMLARSITSISHLPGMAADNPRLFAYLIVLCKLLALPIIKWMAVLQNGRRLPNDFRLSLLSLACPAFTFLFCRGNFYLRSYVDTALMSVLTLVFAWLVFFSNLLLIHLIDRMARTQAIEQEQALAHRALERESTRYQQMLRQHSQTARAIHDVRNRLTVGMGLLHEGQVEEAFQILEQAASAADGSAQTAYPQADAAPPQNGGTDS